MMARLTERNPQVSMTAKTKLRIDELVKAK